jgi:hypothetical protein
MTVFSQKTYIKKTKNNKLKVTKVSFYKGKSTKQILYVKSKLSKDSYYFKIHKSQMVKGLVKKKLFENDSETNKYEAYQLNWKAYNYHGKNVFISETNLYLAYKKSQHATTLIERYGKNKLKITTKIIENHSAFAYCWRPEHTFVNNKKNEVRYIKTKLSPKEYYSKVYKTKMFEAFENNTIDWFSGVLKNSDTRLYWQTNSHINNKLIKDKVSIYRSFLFQISPSREQLYDKTTIEIFNKNILKITHTTNSTTEIKYVETNLLPADYYFKTYKAKMMEIINESTLGSVVMTSHIG